MVEIEVNVTKSAIANAQEYYKKAKELRAKAAALREAVKRDTKVEEPRVKPAKRKQEWFEKFRWFTSSEGFLVLGGRDAIQNEILIKKHTEANDLVFHTEIRGSPFVVVKDGQKAGVATLEQAAKFTGAYSRAWGKGLGSTEVFSVLPDQVSKEAPSGEFIGRGAFMIRGQKTFYKVQLETSVSFDGTKIIYGPPEVVKGPVVSPGYKDQLEVAKKIKAWIRKKFSVEVSTDEIQKALPSGKSDVTT